MAQTDHASDESPWFDPSPEVTTVALGDMGKCYVIDDVLLEPDRLRDWAVSRRDAFRQVDFNAYPGVYHKPPDSLAREFERYFQQHLLPRFDARWLLQMESRLAMVTTPPAALSPLQRLCHSDQIENAQRYCIQASVLYLFEDPSLGGTSFYVPARNAESMADFYTDATSMTSEEFTRARGIAPGYMHGSNDYFSQIGEIPARWNRMIVYDGSILHSGVIDNDRKLTDDPARGRLTYNGFFTCRRAVAPAQCG